MIEASQDQYDSRPSVLEFFAGIGLARIGLEAAGLRVEWANDFEPAKEEMYRGEFGGSGDYVLGDIAQVSGASLPGRSSLAWASSPCTDLSLAGTRAGFAGEQSGTFWHFVRLMSELGNAAPATVVLENVIGLASSHGGDDITAAIRAFNALGYSVDVLVLDARRFVPQSRPRLFLVGVRSPRGPVDAIPNELRPDWLQWVFQDPTLRTHRRVLPKPPALLTEGFTRVATQFESADVVWWDDERIARFVSSLSETQLRRVSLMRSMPGLRYRTAYRRTRNGIPVWEVRADDVAGCLRTARGGSSKQAVVLMGDGVLKVRWMTAREYAALMGAPDYNLSAIRDAQAHFGFGDAVAVPAVAWLGENYLVPAIADSARTPAESVS